MHTQSREEWWRAARRAAKRTQSPGGVVEGGKEGSQTHSEPGGVVEGARRAAKRTQSREEWWRGAGMHFHAHSEPGGMVEGGERSSNHTQICFASRWNATMRASKETQS